MIVETIITGAALTTASKIKEDSLLGMLYKDTLQPSVQLLGKALGSVIEFSTSPMLLCKFGSEVAKLNYQKHLDRYAEKLKSIPVEEMIPVNPQIGAPILERLTYTTNEEIAELFISLLAKASSSATINQAHPAFIQLIERLSVDEARMLRYLENINDIPSMSVRAYLKPEGKGFIEIVRNATDIDVDMLFPDNTQTYLDNLKSLGILDNSHGMLKMNDSVYQPLIDKIKFDELNKSYLESGTYSKLEQNKSYYEVTTFGRSFVTACVSKIKEV